MARILITGIPGRRPVAERANVSERPMVGGGAA